MQSNTPPPQAAQPFLYSLFEFTINLQFGIFKLNNVHPELCDSGKHSFWCAGEKLVCCMCYAPAKLDNFLF